MIGHGVPGLDIRQEHDLPGTCAAVFAALTVQIDVWWPADMRVTGRAGKLALEPSLGAALVETGARGSQAIWGTIDAFEPDRRLYLGGWFGVHDVVAGRVHFDLAEQDGHCRLTLHHMAIGPVPEDLNTRYRAAWRHILGVALRNHLTGTPV